MIVQKPKSVIFNDGYSTILPGFTAHSYHQLIGQQYLNKEYAD